MPSASLGRRSFTLLAAAAVAAPFVRAQGKPEKVKVQIAVDGKAAFNYLPLTIAEQLGYFQKEGLDVEITDFAGGPKALQALVGGAADVVGGAYEHTIDLQARNHFVQSIVLMGRAPQIAMGVSMKAVPNYRTPGDLRGRRIGVSSPGSSANIVANMVLSRAGLRVGDVSYVGVGTAAGALSALRTGQIDAMSNMEPVMTMLEQKGEVRIISDTRTLKGTQDVFGGPMPAACFYTHSDFVRNHPNTCQALANAVVHGLKWLQTAGPSDIIKTVPESYLLGDRALYLASFNKVREAIALDGMLPEDGPKTALRAVASFDASVKADKIDLGKTYTNDFARRAKEKFKA
ncbi:MAG: transporter substrate-binding protein [Ramlibacter sp.]|jgi:NitT/TauT family transport system substrate-binding protein|nr:transporter substrate-binding protein [Ramlibacter sp.]MDB5911766.1 transporter substrate-binding protein [Ramlibacter sp.]